MIRFGIVSSPEEDNEIHTLLYLPSGQCQCPNLIACQPEECLVPNCGFHLLHPGSS